MVGARPFARQDLAALLDLVSGNVAARWPVPPYLMPGDVAWQFPGCAPKDNIRLWHDGAGLLGYLWFQAGGIIHFDVRHDAPLAAPLFSDMLAWAEQRRRGAEPGYPFYLTVDSMEAWAAALRHPPAHPLAGHRHLITSALDGDAARIGLLRSQGFEPTSHLQVHFARALGDRLEPAVVPAGMRLRHVTEDDLVERVRLHVAAWAPGSTFDLERYRQIRAMPPFDPELDIVAVAADGTLASYTIAWPDPLSGVGMFEPFGTRPEYRGSGISRAVIQEGLRRLARKGMVAARVYTAGFNHPAQRLYQACGFHVVEHARTYLRRI